MHNVRVNWTAFVAKPIFDKGLLLGKEPVLTLPVLTEAFSKSAEKIAAVIHTSREKEGKVAHP